jgi:hypothetical protein
MKLRNIFPGINTDFSVYVMFKSIKAVTMKSNVIRLTQYELAQVYRLFGVVPGTFSRLLTLLLRSYHSCVSLDTFCFIIILLY